jgi:hypothetical protein
MVLAQNPDRVAPSVEKPGVEFRMPRVNAMALRMTVVAALALAAGACSSDLSLNNLTLAPKPDTLLRKPDWATFSAGKNDFLLRPITAADLVNADGQCAATPGQGFADPTAAGAAPPATGGVALQMTECDVVRRVGPVEQIDVAVDDRGDRTVVLTYVRGPAPGIYRFTAGRLVSIERAPAPPSAPAKSQKSTSKKPAGT